MGEILEELYDHEGYALRRLPDGTLTGTWTYATQAFTAFVAGCDCGWRGGDAYAPSLARPGVGAGGAGGGIRGGGGGGGGGPKGGPQAAGPPRRRRRPSGDLPA